MRMRVNLCDLWLSFCEPVPLRFFVAEFGQLQKPQTVKHFVLETCGYPCSSSAEAEMPLPAL